MFNLRSQVSRQCRRGFLEVGGTTNFDCRSSDDNAFVILKALCTIFELLYRLAIFQKGLISLATLSLCLGGWQPFF
jgi:hypothetical protein